MINNLPYEVRKINQRLVIVDSRGSTVYAMPFWVKISDRGQMKLLADRFNDMGDYDIAAVMEFETKHSTVDKKRG